jgi:hypothetical protein
MEITTHSLWTLIHGMGFGGLYLMACSGALFELHRHYAKPLGPETLIENERFLALYLTAMSALAWFTVFSGAYIVYPWYRAIPPAGVTNLASFPQRLLMSNPSTIVWHSIGMEWKEHVAWLVPIAITMAAVVFHQYRRNLRNQPALRTTVLTFVWISLIAAGIAGFFGAEIDDHAPVNTGTTIRIVQGDKP